MRSASHHPLRPFAECYKFHQADQHVLKRIILWLLSLIYLPLKTSQLHAIFAYVAKHSLIALNIKKWYFREKSTLDVFDLKKCYDCSVNIKFPAADQNMLKRRTGWLFHIVLALLKLFAQHASFVYCFEHLCLLFNAKLACGWESI